MSELDYAEPERERLRQAIQAPRGESSPSSSTHVQLATDIIQYHILQGLAVTAGSAFGENTAPSKHTCFKLFTALPSKLDNKSTPMHVGGKAFTKHSHRDSSGWWGSSTGTSAHKNNLAEACFERIWAHHTWRNLFWLPHGVLAFEVRVADGHGMRFQKNSSSSDADWTFRGFVEPPSATGHETRWRH
ncbi:hypothetical protein P389DRAFT_194995 [Cystobasidium minutum MCA 4210]|uniref:uncharacterized protein n=1 Tax=Cystobasidium minutum MCA 4210 TaxID=1397322 RepID=UPI0034CEEDEE|eukprot:jgi/Rhomi1/194995/gm1.3209_g